MDIYHAPVLTADEARELLDSIAISRKMKSKDGTETEEPELVGLARPRPDWRDGLHLRPRQRRARDESA